MTAEERRRLEEGGWQMATVEEFLGLTPEESAYIEMKLALARSVREMRRSRQLTQHALARLVRTNQARIARMEAGDPSVSLDSMVKTLLKLGATNEQISLALADSPSNRIGQRPPHQGLRSNSTNPDGVPTTSGS